MSKTPQFSGGRNIAIKVPPHLWESTVSFYRDLLALPVVERSNSTHPTMCFEFGSCTLWVDRVDAMSQSEVWLEVRADDVTLASEYLERAGIVRRDEIEALPADFPGFWVQSPGAIVHLVTEE